VRKIIPGRVMLVIGVYINGLIETDLNRNRENARFVIIDHYALLRMLLGYMTEISRIGNMSAAHVM